MSYDAFIAAKLAIFADTGLGKMRMAIAWADTVAIYTGQPVIILCPLAVAQQFVAEGILMGVEVTHCREVADVRPGINVTNYERLHLFDASRFTGVMLDESSCIKHHDTKTLKQLLDVFADTPFKLCATATPSSERLDRTGHARGISRSLHADRKCSPNSSFTTAETRRRGA
jgi:hypothetical protein